MNTSLRPVERLDLPFIMKLDKSWSENDIIEFVGTPRTRLFILEEGEDNPIGFLAFQAIEEFAAEIVKMAIDKDYQGNDFESILFKKAMSIAKSARMKDLFTVVSEADLYLHNFYKSQNPKDKPKFIKNYFDNNVDGYEFYFDVKDLK